MSEYVRVMFWTQNSVSLFMFRARKSLASLPRSYVYFVFRVEFLKRSELAVRQVRTRRDERKNRISARMQVDVGSTARPT